MSDRIDELVQGYHDTLAMFTEATDKCTSDDPPWSLIHDLADVSEQTVTELATIAREAEAMVDWLVKYAADCGECPRTRYDEDEDGCRECLDSIRRSAHKAVSK